MKALKLEVAADVEDLAWPPESRELSLDSPALEFFTDFLETKPLVIESNVSAIEVQRLMQKAHVRMKIVIDKKGRFMGVVAADDLLDRKILQHVSQGDLRKDIKVTDMMTPRRDLKALGYTAVTSAKINDVINALKNSGEQHCLVVDRQRNQVRGVFSASDISRKLHLPIDIQSVSNFYRVFASTTQR